MTDLPPRVRRCTTHHEACECREWHFDQAIAALRQIREMATFINSSRFDQNQLRRDILDRSREVLEAFNDRTT